MRSMEKFGLPIFYLYAIVIFILRLLSITGNRRWSGICMLVGSLAPITLLTLVFLHKTGIALIVDENHGSFLEPYTMNNSSIFRLSCLSVVMLILGLLDIANSKKDIANRHNIDET